MTATAEVSWDAIVVTAQSLEVASAVASELRAATPDTLVLGVPDPGVLEPESAPNSKLVVRATESCR